MLVLGELFLVFGTLCRGQTRRPAMLQKGLDFFQIVLLPQWVRQLQGLERNKETNRYFSVASTCASLALLQPSIMYRQLIPLRQISFCAGFLPENHEFSCWWNSKYNYGKYAFSKGRLLMSLHKSSERFMVYPTIVYLSCRDLRDKGNNRKSDHGGCFAWSLTA